MTHKSCTSIDETLVDVEIDSCVPAAERSTMMVALPGSSTRLCRGTKSTYVRAASSMADGQVRVDDDRS